jgi:hypothetical protein
MGIQNGGFYESLLSRKHSDDAHFNTKGLPLLPPRGKRANLYGKLHVATFAEANEPYRVTFLSSRSFPDLGRYSLFYRFSKFEING